MADRLPDAARRVARVACALVGAQKWVIYSVGADGNASKMLWADEDEERCAAYLSGHYRFDPLAPHRLGGGSSGLASLRQRLASPQESGAAQLAAHYEDNFMRPYRLSDAIDMLLPIGGYGAGLGISLLRDCPSPAYARGDLETLADFHVIAVQMLANLPAVQPSDVRIRCAARWPQLTSRELDIALAVAAGMPNKVAARHTGMSPATVKKHLHSVYRKCGITNRCQLARLIA